MRLNARFILVPAFMAALVLSAPGSRPGEAKNVHSYNEDGWSHLAKGADYKAVFSFRNALKHNPKFIDSVLGLARAYYNIGEYELAYDLYGDALKLDSRSHSAMTGLGLSLAASGNYTGALKHLNEASALSEENLDARYGIARLYYLIGKKLWARQNLEKIFTVNPYHYDSLLLMGEIKSDEKRLNEAKEYIEKAIQSNSENPLGFIRLGEIFLAAYLNGGADSYADEAAASFNNALAIQPDSYHANRLMGHLSIMKGDYSAAVDYFTKASSGADNSLMQYCIAAAREFAGDPEGALELFLKAYKQSPYDSILRARIENLLVYRDYQIGHPARIMLANEQFDLAVNRVKKNLPDEAVMYLRRAALLNPLHIETREQLMDYYKSFDYDRFFVDEIKDLVRLYPDKNAFRDRLAAAVIKRRDRLYHTEGYSQEEPPRDVPSVLVLNFDYDGKLTSHPDAGVVIADAVNFTLGQFGRMKTFGMRKRAEISTGLRTTDELIDSSLETIGGRVKQGEVENVDIVVYGVFSEIAGNISLTFRVLDFRRGYIIGEFNLSTSGKEALPGLALRAARRVYETVPFSGRPLRIDDDGVLVNLGLFDGLNAGDLLSVTKLDGGRFSENISKNRMIFEIKKIDTLICYVEPSQKTDLDQLDAVDRIVPIKKRRAKLIK
jgi:tetratricopeptide (TPR) repeat protein